MTAAAERSTGARLPLSMERLRLELKNFYRNKLAVFFTFLLPVLLLVVFAALFDRTIRGPGSQSISFRQYFVAGMIAASVFSLSFSSLAIGVAIEQNNGLVKRLAGTPLRRSSYIIGKVGQAIVTSLIAIALTVGLGFVFYGLSLPNDLGRWFALFWVSALSITCCAALGLAYTRVIRDARTAPAFVQPVFLFLLFTSGIFAESAREPTALRVVASLFPLKWMAQGLRYTFLPDWMQSREAAGSWELGGVALMLAAWTIIGVLVVGYTFKWRNRGNEV